jgi:predicted transcriptional regulator of viral defense system
MIMSAMDLLKVLDEIDMKYGRWLVARSALRLFFAEETEATFNVALSRLARQGIIVKIANGLYGNPRAVRSAYFLENIAWALRPHESFYLSLEARLSEQGLISQIPNRLTFMTTGAGKTFNTPYGIIEFVHSKRNPKTFLEETVFDAERGIHVALDRRAIDDLKNTGRSLDLLGEHGVA